MNPPEGSPESRIRIRHRGAQVWHHILLLLTVLLFASYPAMAKDGGQPWLMIGAVGGGLHGEGRGGDEFDPGYGVAFELGGISPEGMGFVFYGTSFYTANNVVGKDSAKARFFVPYYASLRKYRSKGTWRPFLSCGFAWRRMHFDGTNGSDNQYLLRCGLGLLVDGGSIGLQMMARPFAVVGNSLGQTKGVEFVLGISRL